MAKNGNKWKQTGIEPNPLKVNKLPNKPLPNRIYYVINQNKTVSIYVTDKTGVPFPVSVPINIPTDYITEIVSPNGTINVTMLGNIAQIDIEQSILDKINDITKDYISDVSLSGTDLIFTGVNNAFNGSVDLSPILDDQNNYVDNLSFNPSDGILTADRTGLLPPLTVDLDGRYLTSIPSTYLQTGDNISELVNDAGYITTETDPTVPAHVKGITTTDINNWNNDGYISNVQLIGSSLQFTGQFGAFSGSIDISSSDSHLQTLSFNPSDGILTATLTDSSTVDVDLDGRYLTSFTETDPVFQSSPAATITNFDISNWDEAFSWGNHALAGYLTSVDLNGYATESWVNSNFDNYGSWVLSTDGVQRTFVQSGEAIDFVAGDSVTIQYSAGGGVKISSSDTTYTAGDNINISGMNVISVVGLSTVATTGDYNDLINTPTIPTVNNPTISILNDTVTLGDFNLNQSYGENIDISPILIGYATEDFVTSQGYITSETDPTVPSHVKAITTTDISNWNAAEQNVNADWSSFSGDSQILNKPSIVTGNGMFINGTNSSDLFPGQNYITLDFNYLDDRYQSGFKQHNPVRLATTSNITLSGLQTIDGVATVVGDRILVKEQTDKTENGVYNVSSTQWTRTGDFDSPAVGEVEQGASFFVEEGVVNSNTGWTLETPDPIVVGTTNLSFIQYSGAASYTGGDFITVNGTVINHDAGSWVTKTSLTGGFVIDNLSVDNFGHLVDWSTRDLDLRYSLLSHTHTTADITDLSSYTGFTNYYTKTETDNRDAYVSNVALVGTSLQFTAVNNAFGGSVDLSSFIDDTNTFVDSVTFNPSTGDLSLGFNDAIPDVIGNLDGRYLQTESDPVFTASPAFTITNTDITNWNTAFGWGNHALVGYEVQTNKVIDFSILNNVLYPTTQAVADYVSNNHPAPQSLMWNGTTGDLSITDGNTVNLDGRYLQSETDPIFTASPSFGITTTDINNWNSAFANSHVQDTDQYLDFGGVNQISALEINNHIQDTSIHFTQGEISITESQISDLQHYVHPTYTPVNETLTGAQVVGTFTSDGIGSVTGFTTRLLTLADLGYTGDPGATNQTLSWDSVTGNLTISDGNTQNLDGRYALISHTHTTDDITDLSSYSDFNNYYTKTNLQTSGQSSVHWGNITNTPTTLSGYGITNAYTQTQIDNLLSGYLQTETHVDSIAFDILTGVLTLGRNNMNDLTVDLDDRYSLLGHTHTTTDITNLASYAGFTNYYTKSQVDSRDAYISNVELTGTSLSFTGTNSAFSGSIDLSSFIDDTNTFVTNVNFDTDTGDLTLSFNNNPDIVESLDGRYLQSFTETDPLYTADKPNIIFVGDGNSQLTNDAGYITSYTDTTYSAGIGLNLVGTTFSIDNTYTGFTNYYTSTEVDNLFDNYYTQTQSDGRYATIDKTNLPFNDAFTTGDDLETKTFSGIIDYDSSSSNYPTSAGGSLFSASRSSNLAFHIYGGLTQDDELFYRKLNTTWGNTFQVASREWVNAQGFLTSETDSQTLTFSTTTGDLTISNGNTVSLDGRYSLLNHTHTTSDITNLASYSGFNNYYTKTNLQTSGQSQIHWDNLTNTPTEFNPSPHTHPISDIVNLQTELDSKMDRANTITSGYGITASPDFTTPVSIEVNTGVLDTRYLRKDVDDNNGTNTLTLGELVATTATINTDLILPSLATSVSNTYLTYNTTTGAVEKKIFDASSLSWGVANAAGTNQFDVPLESDVRFEGSGDTSVSFNPTTKTITITSIPGSGTGGAVTSFNGRTGGVVSVAGDYSTAQVTETTNLYFTEQRVRDTVLTGLSTATSSDIVATDSVIQAFGKIQGQLNNTVTSSNTATVQGTAGNIIVGGAATQSLSSDPSWTIDLVPSGVTIGTYPKVTVDKFGRVTAGTSLVASDIPNLPASKITSGIFNTARLGTGTANSAYYLAGDSTWKQLSSINVDWGNITNTPTTLSGYGITDAYTSTEVDTLLSNYYTQTQSDGRYLPLDASVVNSIDNSIGTDADLLYNTFTYLNASSLNVPSEANGFYVLSGGSITSVAGAFKAQLFLGTNDDAMYYRSDNGGTGTYGTMYHMASREWVNSQGFLTSETDSQTLSFNSTTGSLSISNGNSVDLDGRWSLLGHTHTLSEITDLNNTDDLPEGATNLYFTNSRVTGIVDKGYVESLGIGYNSLTNLPTLYTTAEFNVDFGNKTTTDLTEGTNLYFTTTRARQSIGVSGDLSYNSTTGIISFNETYSTPSQLLTALLTVDGIGSDLDADLLDNQHGSYYLDYNNFTNTPTITNDIDYIDSVSLVGTSLNITSVGNAFSGTVDLSSLMDDTNNYVNDIEFSTSTGVLTLSFNGSLTDLTQDIDGRYSLLGHTHTTSEITNLDSYTGFTNYYTETQVDNLLSNYVPNSRTITAGNGLTGGGSLSQNRTITLGTPSSVTLSSTNSVTATTHTHAFTPGGTASQYIDGTGALRTFPNVPSGTVTSIATNNGITGGPITTSGTIGLTGQALALHNLDTNGIIVRSGQGTVVTRNIAGGEGISVSNGSGSAGNPTVRLNHLGIEDLVDPNSDKILFWDDSAGTSEWLTLGNNLTIIGTTINATNTNTTYSAGAGLTLTGTTFAINPSYTGFTNYYTETQIDNILTGYSPTTHSHTLDSLSNVTITSNTNGEILKWNGTAWVNNTLSEAGIASSNHTHATLTNGAGLTGANYNGGSATTWAIDSSYTGFTNYYTQTQSDNRFVNISGDVMTGAIEATSFITTGGTSSQFVKGDGSLDGTTYALDSDLQNHGLQEVTDINNVTTKFLETRNSFIKKDVGVVTVNNPKAYKFQPATDGKIVFKHPLPDDSNIFLEYDIGIHLHSTSKIHRIKVLHYYLNGSPHSYNTYAIIDNNINFPVSEIKVGLDNQGNIFLSIGEDDTTWSSNILVVSLDRIKAYRFSGVLKGRYNDWSISIEDDTTSYTNTLTIPLSNYWTSENFDIADYATQSWVTDNFDNYQSWNLKTNGVQRTTIQSGGTLDLVAGTNTTLNYSAGGVVTINSSFNDTTYTAGTGLNLTGTEFSFDTAWGDGRYLQTETDPIFTASPAFGISNTDITNWDTKGVQLTADQPNANIHLRDSAGNIISTLNVGFLNNEGTTIFFNSATDEIELKDDAGNVLSSFPASALMTGVGFGLNLTGSTLELLDSANNIIDSVTLTIANVQGLQAELDGKEPAFSKNTAFNKNFGTTSGTVAEGNDSRILNGQTAYSWGDHSLAGYATETWVNNNFFSVDYQNPVNSSTISGQDMLVDFPLSTYTTTLSTTNTNKPFNDVGGFISFGAGNQTTRILGARDGSDNLWFSSGQISNPYIQVASREWVTSQNYITASSLPTVNNNTITINPQGILTGGGNFTLNQGTNETLNITAPSFGTAAGTVAEGNHTHSASDITSGTFPYSRLPITSAQVSNWDSAYTHSEITSGNPHGVSYSNILGTFPGTDITGNLAGTTLNINSSTGTDANIDISDIGLKWVLDNNSMANVSSNVNITAPNTIIQGNTQAVLKYASATIAVGATASGVFISDGTESLGTAGQVLTSDGTNATWEDIPAPVDSGWQSTTLNSSIIPAGDIRVKTIGDRLIIKGEGVFTTTTPPTQGDIMLTLPVGYRPDRTRNIIITEQNTPVSALRNTLTAAIQTNGEIILKQDTTKDGVIIDIEITQNIGSF